MEGLKELPDGFVVVHGVGHDCVRVEVLAESKKIATVRSGRPSRQDELFPAHQSVSHLGRRGITRVGSADDFQTWKHDALVDIGLGTRLTERNRDSRETNRDAGRLVLPNGNGAAGRIRTNARRLERFRHRGNLPVVDDQIGLNSHVEFPRKLGLSPG